MTISDRMINFKRMAERFAREGKLLTTQEKASVKPTQFQLFELESSWARFPRLQLVLHPGKKHIPH